MSQPNQPNGYTLALAAYLLVPSLLVILVVALNFPVGWSRFATVAGYVAGTMGGFVLSRIAESSSRE